METHTRIQRYLAAFPGASTQMVAEHLDVDHSTADYHLRRLLRRARVTREVSSRETSWFNVGCALCPVLRRAVPAFRRPSVAAVALSLDEIPSPLTIVADAVGVEEGEARWAFEVLLRLGLARRSRTGRAMLAPGADVCVVKARAGASCRRWGECEPSAAHLEREAAKP